MPLSTSYDSEANLIRLVGEGPVSMEERRHTIGQMFLNREYSNDSDILVDVSRITNAPTDLEFFEVARLVKVLRSRFAGRIAIVNARMGHLTVSHLVALSADPEQNAVRVFYSGSEALSWLGR